MIDLKPLIGVFLKSTYIQSFIWTSHPTAYISRGLLLRLFANTSTRFPERGTSSGCTGLSEVTAGGGCTQDISLVPPQPWICQAGWENYSSLPCSFGRLPQQVPELLPQGGALSTTAQHGPGSSPFSSCWDCTSWVQLQACGAVYQIRIFAVAATTGLGQLPLTSQGNPKLKNICLRYAFAVCWVVLKCHIFHRVLPP